MPRYRPRVIAHRGYAARAPENTVAAFRMALESGADALETDLWLTTDDRIVLHHDATAERMADDPRRIDSLSMAEVRSLSVRPHVEAATRPGTSHSGSGRDGVHRVPSLDDLLDLTPAGVQLVLELKDDRFARERNARLLLAAIDGRIAARSAVIVSFSLPVLRTVKAVRRDALVGHITLRNPLPTQPTELLGPYWPLLAVNPLYVAMAHRRGRVVAPLDPGLHRRLRRYLRMGVDGVLTDDPAATRALVDRLLGGSLPARTLSHPVSGHGRTSKPEAPR